MIKNWSRAILALIALPIIVVAAAVLSTNPYLIISIIFPLVFVAFLLSFFDSKPVVKLSLSVSAAAQTTGKEEAPAKVEEEEEGPQQPQQDLLVYVGDEILFNAKVRIEQGVGLFFIRFPAVDTFELGENETNVHLVFKGFRKVEEREYKYKMKALRRGLFKFPEISFSHYPPLGISRMEQGSVPSNVEIKVLPRIQLLKRSQLSLRSLVEIPRSSRARLGPHSTDFLSIRDYSVGDPYKFINWKASSRIPLSDKLLINEYEREGLRTFIFVLDRSYLMRRGTAEENPLEYGIAFVLSYTRILLNYGMNVGVWLEPEMEAGMETKPGSASEPGAGVPSTKKFKKSYIMPSSGIDHYQRIKEMLIATEPISAVSKSPMGPTISLERVHIDFSTSSLLPRVVRESVPIVNIVTNFERSNRTSIARFANMLLKAGASSVSIIDVIPYNIVSKYSQSVSPSPSPALSRLGDLATPSASSPGTSSSSFNASSSLNLGSFLKSILISTKKKDQYSILPRSVSVIPWDPASESVGRAIRMSIALAKNQRRTTQKRMVS